MEGHDKSSEENSNEYLAFKITSLVTSSVVNSSDDKISASRSKIDSHANMVVLGRHCFVC